MPELESIYRSAPVGLGVLDEELRFLRVNDRLAEMNGVPAAEHIGRLVTEVLPNLDPRLVDMLRGVLATGEPLRDVEVRGETPAQPGVQRVWIEQIGPMRDGAGRINALSVVAEEVTARRQAEASLKRSEETLSLAMEAAGLAVWEWNLPSNELKFGANWEQIIGHRVHEGQWLREGWHALMHDDDRPATNACIEAHVAGQSPVYECEYRLRHADGHWVWVASRGRVVEWDAQGRPLRMIGVGRDITQARENADRLRESERDLRHWKERLQVALDAGRMGVWDWTPGSNTFWSAEVYKLLGMPETDQAPEAFHFLQMVHPEDRAVLDAEVGRVLAKGGDYESEFRVVRADSQVRWLVSRGRVLHDESGSNSRLVGVNFDITDRKMVEKALQEADTRRTEFLAMLAHELRNPLAPIVNAVRLLEIGGDEADRRDAATQILRRQTAHLARLVDDLLEASRITQGRIELRIENVLLATCAFQAVEAARPQAREQRQTLKVDIPPTLDLVADPARLTQIIANLVTNAVKYTPEGGDIEVLAQVEANDWLSIIVQDNGPGIAADLRPLVFELFTQDPRTLDRSRGGLGIGLALVKRLAELHGGHVRYESRADGLDGARFVVCLPRNGRRNELRGSVVTSTSVRVPPLPVLVVDDNRDAAETLAALLRVDGHRVDVAYDGEQALVDVRSTHPKLVVLDLGLPRLDGLEVARRLRQDDRFQETILVAVSGYAQAADRVATAAAGFNGHLAKPVDLADLYRIVEEALAGGHP